MSTEHQLLTGVGVMETSEWLEGQIASCKRLLLLDNLTPFQRQHAEKLLAQFQLDLERANHGRSDCDHCGQ